MKHLILQYAELPEHADIDFSIIEYDPVLNLNIIKDTKIPAVIFSDQATETFTKTYGEGADSDRDLKDKINSIIDTSTQTRVHSEISDSDANHNFANNLDTSTLTFVKSEASDSDKNFKDMEYLSITNTITETAETMDSDK